VTARPWWQPRDVLRRYVADLLADDLARQRRQALPHPLPWPDDLRLVEDVGVDSLELINLATALAEALHLHESGIEDYLLARRTLGDWVDIAAAGLERFDARITFRTSGSTGAPKPCVHGLDTLRQETAHLATLFPGTQRILCAVPAHHIYRFLFGVLLPQALGLGLDAAGAVRDLRTSTPAWLARNAQAGDLVIGHPDWWAAVARTVPVFPLGVMGVSSTAPCPDSTSEALEAARLLRLVQCTGRRRPGASGHADRTVSRTRCSRIGRPMRQTRAGCCGACRMAASSHLPCRTHCRSWRTAALASARGTTGPCRWAA
jgi:4-coumarate--CoA ligase (photoactive yellow protein activation family)